eukprot:1041084-Pelagomonas_calceolata.AAC.2
MKCDYPLERRMPGVLHLPFLCLHLRWQHPHYGQVGIRVGRDKAGKVQGKEPQWQQVTGFGWYIGNLQPELLADRAATGRPIASGLVLLSSFRNAVFWGKIGHRNKYGLNETPCSDCCVHCWCSPCAVCQVNAAPGAMQLSVVHWSISKAMQPELIIFFRTSCRGAPTEGKLKAWRPLAFWQPLEDIDR